jgi:VanZ family protein
MFKKPSELVGGVKILWYTLVALIIFNLIFIFTQSSLPSEVAGEEAGTVTDIVVEILPDDSPAEDYAENNMDKIAHFTEYASLGFFVSLFICFFGLQPQMLAPFSLLFAEVMAFIDETIQIFSGRNPDIKDMWSDILGFLTLSIITYLAFFLVKRLLKKEIQNG